jgi:formylglycine-generating enzyme required for sulfatase activity
LLDLAGNVWEWMANDYNGGKELRGGSWPHANPVYVRASYRSGYAPSDWDAYIGFRCGV